MPGTKKKLKIARNLLRKKTPVDEIAEITGLTLEEARRLADDL
jgi:predicted transposase YdaD